jgi:RNA polymerase sigma-70 factor (ECF subfamily)
MKQDTALEQRLLVLIASGDQGALDQLYLRYHARLAHYLLQRLGHSAKWAEDVLQEVFLNIWYSARSYQPHHGSPATWIFGIVHHQLAKAYRSWSRHSIAASVPMEMLDDVAEMDQSSTEEAIVSRLTMADAFARLSPKHREILELVFYQGFTFEECARILVQPSIPPTTPVSQPERRRGFASIAAVALLIVFVVAGFALFHTQ